MTRWWRSSRARRSRARHGGGRCARSASSGSRAATLIGFHKALPHIPAHRLRDVRGRRSPRTPQIVARLDGDPGNKLLQGKDGSGRRWSRRVRTVEGRAAFRVRSSGPEPEWRAGARRRTGGAGRRRRRRQRRRRVSWGHGSHCVRGRRDGRSRPVICIIRRGRRERGAAHRAGTVRNLSASRSRPARVSASRPTSNWRRRRA
jgi:hypothetical protein